MIDYKHYNLMYSMGVATQPVITPYTACFPTYLSYIPPCQPYTVPPPSLCSQKVTSLPEEDILLILNEFTDTFPELKKDPVDLTIYLPFVKKIGCLYPTLACVDDDCSKARFFLLLAHYITLQPNQNDSINAVSSSSVGDVSISYDTTHTQRTSPFFVWLNKTPYGRELIAILKSKPGIVIV